MGEKEGTMHPHGWKVLAIAAALAALALASCKKAGGLDGKTFKVKLTDPSGKADDDELKFAGGTFDSMGCQKYGFKAAAYTASASGPATSFRVEAKSDKEGTNQWEGKVEGDKISGTLVWSKPGQAPIRYSFAGAIAK
jgi:hypothetical protein